MRSTFMGLETAKRSLFVSQTALQTTGHNISNADTAGYTRQRVNLTAARPNDAFGMNRSNAPGQLGQGVEYSSITRIREKFLDDQYMSENKFLGEWEVRRDTLDKLEAIVNEPSDTGLRQVIDGFWNSWQQLSKTPEDSTARVLVKQRALTLTDAFNHTGKQLQDLSNDMTNNIDVNISQVNSLSKQVTSLNGEINRLEGLGDNANDLRDQRDLLVDNLSKIVNIQVTDGTGGYTVQMGGVTLAAPDEDPAVLDASTLKDYYDSGDLTSGEVFGMIYARDVHVADYQKQLDLMVKGIAEADITVTLPAGTVVPDGTTIGTQTYSGKVIDRTLAKDTTITVKGLNGLHQLGYSSGNQSPPGSGIPFFTQKTPGEWSAQSFTLNPDIVKDVSLISSSLRTYEDASGAEKVVGGNNAMALLMAGAKDISLDFGAFRGPVSGPGNAGFANGTFNGFFQSLVGGLGVQSQEATRQAENQKALVQQVDANRQSVSGVSLDEEMADMMKFQHAYNAAARFMTTIDETLDKVINGMGLVGR